ncbi:MAG: hypothetical protein ABEI74_00060 [Candidatus Pacearchaeota archaeon]
MSKEYLDWVEQEKLGEKIANYFKKGVNNGAYLEISQYQNLSGQDLANALNYKGSTIEDSIVERDLEEYRDSVREEVDEIIQDLEKICDSQKTVSTNKLRKIADAYKSKHGILD